MINGSMLKEKRLSLKLSQLDVANQACLSLNQVQALEDDDASPFYSNQIRLQCLKRVAMSLGIALAEIDETASNIAPDYLLNINGPPALSLASHLHKKVFLLAREARPFVGYGLLMIGVLLAINYLLARSQSEPAAVTPTIAQAATPPVTQPVTPLGNAKKNPPDLAGSITEQVPAEPVMAVPEVAVKVEVAEPVQSNTQTCYEGSDLATLQVSDPIKAANKVYFSSASAQTICISDANNHLKRFHLSDRRGVVFRGSPPFIVSAENFSSLALFFQGKKVQLGDTTSGAVKLSASPLP